MASLRWKRSEVGSARLLRTGNSWAGAPGAAISGMLRPGLTTARTQERTDNLCDFAADSGKIARQLGAGLEAEHPSLGRTYSVGVTTPARVTLSRTAALRRRIAAVRPSRTSRHRDVRDNTARAAVLGAGDGLITNVSLILGVAGASTNASTVRLAGVAGLLAGAFSMAAGELVSLRAQHELVQRELDVEREELADEPEAEFRELAAMYRARGVPARDAETVARILSANDAVALDTHARLELGIDPESAGAAGQASIASSWPSRSGRSCPCSRGSSPAAPPRWSCR